MAEQAAPQPEPMEEQVTETTPEETAMVTTEEHESHGVPRGAIAFGIIMILGYAFYFFMIWSEVIARGGQ